jgi:hypothetical protein
MALYSHRKHTLMKRELEKSAHAALRENGMSVRKTALMSRSTDKGECLNRAHSNAQ